jgi:probable rRNA maturation factor
MIRGTLALEGLRAGEIGLRLSDDAELRALNRQWRGIDRATDVLSFPYSDGADDRVSGDLVISVQRAVEQARRYRVSFGRELARLVIHGTLHLAGHDHHLAGERAHMRALRRSRPARGAGGDRVARRGVAQPAAKRLTSHRASGILRR